MIISALLVDVSRSGGGFGDTAAAFDGVGTGVVLARGEGCVDVREDGCGALGVGADDDAVGMKEVGDGGTFAQKLRIGDDVEELPVYAVALDGPTDPLVGVDGNGALFDDDLVGGDGACDLAGDGLDVGEISVACLGLGCSDGDEDGFALLCGLGEVGREADAGVAIAFQEGGKVVLMDQGVTGLKCGDFAFVVIDTDDIVSHLCEADGSDETDVSGANDSDLNSLTHGRI